MSINIYPKYVWKSTITLLSSTDLHGDPATISSGVETDSRTVDHDTPATHGGVDTPCTPDHNPTSPPHRHHVYSELTTGHPATVQHSADTCDSDTCDRDEDEHSQCQDNIGRDLQSENDKLEQFYKGNDDLSDTEEVGLLLGTVAQKMCDMSHASSKGGRRLGSSGGCDSVGEEGGGVCEVSPPQSSVDPPPPVHQDNPSTPRARNIQCWPTVSLGI